MATKNYMINDKWLDLDKQNIVELQSVDGVLDSLKVNGSEIETPSGKIMITENGTDIDVAQYALADVNVEGGGGSSDFSKAEVTIINSSRSDVPCAIPIAVDEHNNAEAISRIRGDAENTYKVILYKGTACLLFDSEDIAVTGAITIDDGLVFVTGDGTITIS